MLFCRVSYKTNSYNNTSYPILVPRDSLPLYIHVYVYLACNIMLTSLLVFSVLILHCPSREMNTQSCSFESPLLVYFVCIFLLTDIINYFLLVLGIEDLNINRAVTVVTSRRPITTQAAIPQTELHDPTHISSTHPRPLVI